MSNRQAADILQALKVNLQKITSDLILYCTVLDLNLIYARLSGILILAKSLLILQFEFCVAIDAI